MTISLIRVCWFSEFDVSYSSERFYWWGYGGLRTYIPEPKRKSPWDWWKQSWSEKQAIQGNHRRVQGNRSKRLQKELSARSERSFAHMCETGDGRRSWLRGLEKAKKRYGIQAAAWNLGLMMRAVFGIGKPRCLQGVLSFVYSIQVIVKVLPVIWSRRKRFRQTLQKNRTAIPGWDAVV